MVARDLVEFVAMDDEVALAVGHGVHVFADQGDIAETDADMFAQGLVVVARDEHHVLAVSRAAQDLLHDGVLRRRPAHVALHRPEIDDVADQQQVLGRIRAQEVEQALGLAGARAEMHVGDEHRAHTRQAHGLRPMKAYQGTRSSGT